MSLGIKPWSRWSHSAARRFQEKIIWLEDCWLWIGLVWEQHNNLPLFWLKCWQRSARRVAWEMRHGLLSTDEVIQFICERPLCVNPAYAQERFGVAVEVIR
ncbi:hypothetical protein TFLX_04411 [Thermoflexales bacterium]|nr:hypothetical protein TFLX_04411 [Thermoflexales bacterium]